MKHRDPKTLISQFEIANYDDGSEFVTVECPYHNDKHDDVRSCHGRVNKEHGGFNCWSCGATGTLLKLIATKYAVPVNVIEARVDGLLTATLTDFDASYVSHCHTQLLGNPEAIAQLENRHGISKQSIVKYSLGWYNVNSRITIPVYNINNQIVDFRMYKYDPSDPKKKLKGIKGAESCLFLAQNIIDNNTVYVTEGEFKSILLSQMGFPACCGTAGAGTWSDAWSTAFKNKDVVIVYDVDKPGRRGADKVIRSMLRYVNRIKNVFLADVVDIENGDITDYVVKKHKTAADFKELVEKTPWLSQKDFIGSSSIELERNDPIELRLSNSSKAEYNGKIISTVAVVSAKAQAPYVVPKKCAVLCMRDKDYCHMCKIYAAPADSTFVIPPDDPELLKMVGTTEKGQKDALRKISGIYINCKSSSFNVTESYNVDELRLVPQIAIGHTSEEQITRKAFFVGHGLASNNSYKFLARACPSPTDSVATFIAYEAAPQENDIDTYKRTMDLSVFSPIENTVESIKAKLDDIYEDFEVNVTRIYQRRDLHIFFDLIWHSALFVTFQGRELKGWVDALVIGDSGQGKSECSSRLRDHYKCGERVDTKRASIAGIVGGLQQTSDRWFITWGTIPLNDRRLVILEEIKGMMPAALSAMTDMRSSGVAELIKIDRAKTMARTRLAWISNPRSDSKMAAYNYGVNAVQELIGAPEDIRRFDMVMAVVSGEVPLDIVNKRNTAEVKHEYTSELCQDLIGWCWSRKPSQVVISTATEDRILKHAQDMGKTYSSTCPIVEPSDQRLKITRLAAALAGRLYSTTDGENLIVLPEHVDVVVEFLNRIYKSRALGYHDFSQSKKGEEDITDPEGLEKILAEMPNARDSINCIIDSDLLRPEDIQNITDWPVDRSNEFIGLLVRKGAIRRSRRGGYRKTSAFIDILKKLDRMNLQSETYKERISRGEF
jgi:hypothetical protein